MLGVLPNIASTLTSAHAQTALQPCPQMAEPWGLGESLPSHHQSLLLLFPSGKVQLPSRSRAGLSGGCLSVPVPTSALSQNPEEASHRGLA